MHAHPHAVAKQQVLLHFFLSSRVEDLSATSVKPEDCLFRASVLVRIFPIAHKAVFLKYELGKEIR